MLELLGLEESLRQLSNDDFEAWTKKANATMATEGRDALRSLLRVGIHLLELKRRIPRKFHAVADRLAVGIERSMRAKAKYFCRIPSGAMTYGTRARSVRPSGVPMRSHRLRLVMQSRRSGRVAWS